ncbi:MAG: EF-hand domain-containing protein [Pseudomonadota bacterium]
MSVVRSVAIATTVLSTTAFANAIGMFNTLDADHNGLLRRPELAAHPALTARFAQADQNRDGALSLAEFEALLAMPGATPSLE